MTWKWSITISACGEGLLDNAHHAVGEVHRHLLDFISALFLYLVKMLRHVSNGRALDCNYECSLLAVSVPVGEERDQVMVESIVSSMHSRSPMFFSWRAPTHRHAPYGPSP